MTHRLLDVDGHAVTVSDPERRLCGDTGATKLEIMAYYIKVAPRLVPFLCGRATSTVFGPDESTRVFRFARTAPPGCAGRFPTYRLTCFAKPQPESYLTVPDGGTLEALVDYGCMSFHPWNSLAATALQPSQMVFNLDPEAIAFREVRNAALLLRDLLIACGLTSWAKTSGGHGMHVLVPLNGRGSFEDTHLVAETIVRRAIRREPTLFSRDPRRARRRGRILIDTSRNACGGTLIAPYSVATSGLVSAPVEWDELERPMYPEDFDMTRVIARESADLNNHAVVVAAEQSVEPLLGLKRVRSASIDRPPQRHDETKGRFGKTPAVVIDEARWPRAKSGRVRVEAEVARIESADVQQRARKLLEEGRDVP
jgi:DNA ligase D-like protein (predicted polymerase)